MASPGAELNPLGLLQDSSLPVTLEPEAQWEHGSPGTTDFMAKPEETVHLINWKAIPVKFTCYKTVPQT